MKNFIFVNLPLICFIGLVAGFGVHVQASNSTLERNEKFLSLFSVVRFANSQCYGSNGYNGTCLTAAECSQSGGNASGSCASGFGVCCTVFVSTCGSTVSLNNTYWQNSGYTSTTTTAGQCSVYVKKCATNICQIRLDFINFVIANPDAAVATACTTCTQCLTDIFTVSGASNNIPAICGTNTNKHMYIDMSSETTSVTLNMLLTGTSTSRSWQILISQIPCGTSYTAPYGCLQWYTSATGTLTSFDYQFVSAATTPVQKLANQDYTICIRTNQGFCGICYTACTGIPSGGNAFLMSSGTGAAVDFNCIDDWIQIPCAIDYQNSGSLLSGSTTTGCASRICGSAFSAVAGAPSNAPVYSYRQPFEVRVFTDSYDTTDATGIGFCLQYTQQPCSVSSG